MAAIENNRWSVQPDECAVRIMVPDLKGFFKSIPTSKALVVEPGTRALVVDDNGVLGEVPPGSYTMESFVERLQFWRDKQTTIFLFRGEDISVDAEVKDVVCMDNVCLDIACRWTFQVSELLSFMQNLMGANDSVTIADIVKKLSPTFEQAIRMAVGRTGYDEIKQPDMLGIVQNSVKSEVDPKFLRYGFSFVGIETFQPKNSDPEMEKVEDKQGDNFRRKKEIEMIHAAGRLDNEELGGKLDNTRDAVYVRQQLRDVVSSDKLNKFTTKEEFSEGIFEIDKKKLLRREERDDLIAGFEERKEDREGLRSHLLETIDVHRERELDELRLDMDFAIRQKTLAKEIELSELSNSADAEEWRHELLREREESQHRNEEKHKKLTARWQRIREVQNEKRDDSWKSVLHEQKMDEVQADLEIARADRGRQVALIESDLETRLADEKLQVQKRQEEWDLELQSKKSVSQMEKMQRLQEMNAKFAERELQVKAEVEKLKADSESERELNRIKAMGSLSTEALVATAGADNAALLADLKKHESTQDAIAAQANAQPGAELNEERLRMYEKMNESAESKADAIAEAYKTAMSLQQGQAPAPAQAHAPPPMAPQSPPPMANAQGWHAMINGQQQGPYPLNQLVTYIQGGQVNHQTMVWKTGMAGWVAAAQAPELAGYLPPPPPPPPPIA